MDMDKQATANPEKAEYIIIDHSQKKNKYKLSEPLNLMIQK